MFAGLDRFSQLQNDILSRGRTSGGALTLCLYLLMLLGASFEVWNFLSTDWETSIHVDHDSDDLLQVNVNITMHEMECKNLRLIVKDSFGTEPLNLFNDFAYRPVTADGVQAGAARQEVSPEEMEAAVVVHSVAGQTEIDSDWDSSHDGFKHQSFDDVIAQHDFVFANFFASWCSHCQNFAPTWTRIAQSLGSTPFQDADGAQHNVLFIKVNCVDFDEVCMQESVQAYPTLRLYKKDRTWSEFDDNRDLDAIRLFIEQKVHGAHFVASGFADRVVRNGCNIEGRVLLPRVPGMFKIEAGGDTAHQRVNTALVNVSHTIWHLSFSNPNENLRPSSTGFPDWVAGFINPLDGKSFYTVTPEKTPHHYLKIVATKSRGSHVYQVSATSREARLTPEEVPEMRIMYDLEPMMIEISVGRKPWYDFLCGLLGVAGGIYVTAELLFSFSISASKKIVRMTSTSSQSMRSISSTTVLSES